MKKLMLTGVVIDWNENFRLKQVNNFLTDLEKDEEFTVYINSPGGYVDEGTAIYNLLAEYHAQSTIKIIGCAGSIASVVAMASDNVLIAESATMFLHKPWSWGAGNSDDMEFTAEELKRYETAITHAYTAKTGKTEKQVKKILSEERTFLAEDLMENGFVDKIYKPTKETQQRANAQARMYNQTAKYVALQTSNPNPKPKEENIITDVIINNEEIVADEKALTKVKEELATAQGNVDALNADKQDLISEKTDLTNQLAISESAKLALKTELETANATIADKDKEISDAAVNTFMAENNRKIKPADLESTREELAMFKANPELKYADGTTMYDRKKSEIEARADFDGLNQHIDDPETPKEVKPWDAKTDGLNTTEERGRFVETVEKYAIENKMTYDEAEAIVAGGIE